MAMRSIIIALFLALAAFAQEQPAYNNTQQDSIEARYTKKAERSTQSGARFKSVSTKLFIGGGIGLAVSVPAFIYSISISIPKKSKDSTENMEPADDISMAALSFAGICASIGVLIAGAICKYSSVRRFRDAEHFKKELELYRQQKPSISLEILPTFNPINQAFGGNLLLDF